ncbi:MAG: restriction endonuclease subunit S [Desulfobacterales bacterium]|nr:restriction endonuclease subunit S [Desulfobacterales bacterium]
MKRVLPFAELVEINPRVTLEKGTKYPFVEMGVVESSRRYVHVARVRHFKSGGAKFLAGDTLFARITPCLENGKIAQFQAFKGTAAFGSTEFFVFRARSDISDPAYVYYLAKSDFIRKPAEKSMSGASGRQRADLKSIVDLEVPAPPLPIQRKIAAILSAYDDLIENNLRRIKILEEMAQALYREWFVKFRFPGHENVRMVDSPLGKIPGRWEVIDLVDSCNIVMGQSPKSEFYNTSGDGLPFHQGVTNFGPRFPTERVFCTVKNRIAESGDILLSVRAPVGRINLADKRLIVGRGLCAIHNKNGQQWFTLHQLKERFQQEDTMGGGTIFKAVTRKDVESIEFLNPANLTVQAFEEICHPIEAQIKILTEKNNNLRQTRDLLLPKLISGELDVSDLDIKIGGYMQ